MHKIIMNTLLDADFFWLCPTCDNRIDFEESENAPVCKKCKSLMQFTISFNKIEEKE